MLNIYLLLVLGSLSVIHGSSEDVEVIYLPARNSGAQDEVPFSFTAFGDTINLKLQKNHKLLAPSFQVWRHNNKRIIEEVPELNEPSPCHYLHSDTFSTAAISLCEEGVINGLVLLDNAALEIKPLRETKSPNLFHHLTIEGELKDFFKEPHVVRRTYFSEISLKNSDHYDAPNSYINFAKRLSIEDQLFSRRSRGRSAADLTIELAVFFDEAAFNIFSPFFDRNEKKIRDMLLAYINGVQALFYHPSLGARIDLALVRLDIMHRQPFDLSDYGGERGKLLDSFCAYVESHNPFGDDHPYHWDIALYVSGLDFYAAEDGSRATMGAASFNGACSLPLSCVIAEFGVTDRLAESNPSAGFTSVYIAAHEIGHNLGMEHDSVDNSCSEEGFIMSPSRDTHGETVWSLCSRSVALGLYHHKPCLRDKPSVVKHPSLDHTRHLELPGREWTSKKQCEVFLRDKDATVVTLSNACQALRCRSPHRSGYHFAGPALDGTLCSHGKECRGGECLPALQIQIPRPQKPETMKIGWSKWKEEPCTSGCIKKSKGARARRRVCREPHEGNTSACTGIDYDVLLCNDNKLCNKRSSVENFAEKQCRSFSKYVPEFDPEGDGLQVPHEKTRLWTACTIFCKRSGFASLYTPLIELNDLNLDPYFPDGTWCHNEGGKNYFCLHHHCLPESFRFGKNFIPRFDNDEELIIGPQNAAPGNYTIPNQLVRNLSLGTDGLLLSRNLLSRPIPPVNDDA